jgi:putative nucleotidyltransferase with HDIG domain
MRFNRILRQVLQQIGARRMEIYAGALTLAAVATAAAVVRDNGLGDLWAVAVLAAVGAVAERGSIRLTSTVEESISMLPTLFAAVLFGPAAAMIVGGVSMLGDFNSAIDRPRLKWVTYTSARALGGAISGVLATQVREVGPSGIGGIALATTVCVLAMECFDVLIASVTLVLRGKGRLTDVARNHWPVVLASIPLYAPLVSLLAVAYEDVSPWTLVLFFVPALAAQRSFILYQQQRQLATDLSVANDHLERANLSFATALVATLDARDRYTAGHSAAVAVYARDIAVRMGLPEDQQQLAHVCGLVHDIGKIGLPAGLLEKPGPLTLEERRQMERHSEIGERILANVEDYGEIARIVRHHHERVDGEGYPDRLLLEEIPLLSRIIAVADAYNAMTSDRPYRDAMPSRVARLRLAQAVESQFDTAVVAVFEAILAGATEDYRAGSHMEFSIERQRLAAQAVSAA